MRLIIAASAIVFLVGCASQPTSRRVPCGPSGSRPRRDAPTSQGQRTAGLQGR